MHTDDRNHGIEGSATGDSVGRDDRLRLVRRLDWRFLLPHVIPEKVAYIGPEDKELFAALSMVSGTSSVTRLDNLSDKSDVGRGCNGLVILRSIRSSDLRVAVSLLKRGGFLYWEIDKKGGWLGGKRWRSPAHFVGLLAGLGIGNSRAYWHRPSFESCLEILPLAQDSALKYLFGRRSGNPLGRMKLIVARFLLTTKVLYRLLPCLSIVAVKR